MGLGHRFLSPCLALGLALGAPLAFGENTPTPDAKTVEPTPSPAKASLPATPEALLTALKAGTYSNLSEEELRPLLAGVDAGMIIDAGILLLKERPEYVVTLEKRERIRGDYLPMDTIEVHFRRAPLGIFAHYIDGPYKSRQIIYDDAVKPGKITVAEAGLLGFMSLSLDYNSSLTQRTTNHNIKELGMEYPLLLMKKDLAKLAAAGQVPDITQGRLIKNKGRTLWELKVKTPGPPGYYAKDVRLGFDLSTGLVMLMEIKDGQGTIMEFFDYTKLSFGKHPPGTFDPDNPAYRF